MSGNLKMALIALLLCFTVGASAQTINGTVTDNTGEPIIGATVIEDGLATNGVVTDIDGNYSLTLKGNSNKLVFSYVGMKTQTIAVAGRSTINVTLEDEATSLNDVVVIGYGTMRRKDLTGSVATVNSDDIAAVPVSNATEALTGKMAGVQVTTTEGSPDADVKIRVRGGGSITQSSEPLFIVDGFPVESISDIAPTDIEDMTVLKDASSTAIYGSRGANGVILITTKSGKEGRVSVKYNAYYSWKKVANSLDVLGSYDYAKWQYELAMLRNKEDHYLEHFGAFEDMDMYRNIPTNDWQDLTYGRTGHTFNHNLSINGGTEKMKYAFGYTHLDDKAIMETSSYKRDNLSLKLNHKPNKALTLDFTVRFSKTDIYGGGANDQTSSYNTDKRLRYAVQYTPFPVQGVSGYDEDMDAGSNFYSPLTSLRDNDRRQARTQLNLGGAVTWQIIKNLKFKTEVGYDIYRNDQKRFYGVSTYYVQNVPASENKMMPAIGLSKQNRTRFRNTNTLNYDFKALFEKDSPHHLNALIGEEYILTKEELLSNTAHGFPVTFSAQDCWSMTTLGTPFEIRDFYYPNEALLSWFGRVNYDYDSKYLFSATFRADGSSKFASGDRWGYFPSAAFAWRISSEKFMESTQSWLVRLSYGTAGNNNIPAGISLAQQFESASTSWVNGYSSYVRPLEVQDGSKTIKNLANAGLTWETTITRNIGLDFALFHSKLNGTLEYYLNTTKDLLIQYPIAGSGYDYQYRNMGKTQNQGIELSLNWAAINKPNYGLSIGANVSFNKNKVKSLGDLTSINNISTNWASTEIDQDFIIRVGEPIGQLYGYVTDGRYTVDDFDIEASMDQKKWVLKDGVADASGVLGVDIQPGLMKLKETKDEKTGKITAEDRQIIGDTNPTCTGGFNINARAYGFDLVANFNWSLGNDVYNANKLEYTQTSKYDYRNLSTEMADGKRWTNIDANGNLLNWNNAAELAQLNQNTTMWTPYTGKYVFTDYGVEDASFLRLATLTIGYTLPKSLLMKTRVIQNARIYATCYNLFVITNYSGYDPEVSAVRNTNLTPGVDYSAYPKSRQFLIGINLDF